ncbi:hypothetical protein PHMEG_00022846 [Phytophthora megakarya]|uniref:Uncharacterized protein n=1 Tax=Phytophthora megakarya TaxID=4795 RepID=A0A225VI81_9STRA|nr:hypothetical protein PHMEG_00022846 [Phytophthora megakarya]
MNSSATASRFEKQERPAEENKPPSSQQQNIIRLNKKVRRARRPKLDPKARTEGDGSLSKKFNKQIKAAGDIADEDIVIAQHKLDSRDRSFVQVQTAIETIPTNHANAASKIPKIGTDSSPVLSACISVLLPENLAK